MRVFPQIAGPLHYVVGARIKESKQARASQLFRSAWTLHCQLAFELLKEKFRFRFRFRIVY